MCALWCAESGKYGLRPLTARAALGHVRPRAALPLARGLWLLTAVNSRCSSGLPAYGEVGLGKKGS